MSPQDFSEYLRALNQAKIGGKTVSVTPAITTTSTPYTATDCVGGLIVLKDVMYSTNGTALLKSIQVKDASNQKVALTILLFNSAPSGMTVTDNAGFAYGTTSFPQQIAKINILTTDYETIDSKATASLDEMAKVVQADGGKDLYMVVITTGAPTYGANNTSLSITLSFLQD